MAIRVLLPILALVSGNALSQDDYVNGECYVNDVPARCEPIRMSFSLYQEATASSTCGEPATPFCARSVSLGRISSDCSEGEVCDANDPNNAHGAMYLTDFPLNEMSWWQSKNSVTTDERVVIDIPLLTLAEIAFISINFHSIKAAAFHLERSTDYGNFYYPYHYLAISCEDQFGIIPEAELTPVNETSALCQTIPQPPTPGTITFFPAIDRPSANDSTPGYSELLYQYITATNIRLILDQHYPLELGENDPGYYYALDDINVIGSCQCYGHASQCTVNSQTGAYECVCSHNTGGSYCERCQEFYNDVPWQRADGNGPFECKICNCNNHSSECVFNEEVYEETGQISGGVCLNCDDKTAGRQCESCAPFYYPRQDRNHTATDACDACQCSLLGVVDDGDCVKVADGMREPGDCYCKANVMGKQCNMCMPGYYNLSAQNPDGCQACSCRINGSSNRTCNHITGECECKQNVIGAQCDVCRENYYQPDPNEGCLPCDCNLGGSLSPQCDMVTGQCDCLQGVTGTKCTETIPGYFFPAIDHLRLEGESSTSIPPSPLILSSGEGELFTGTGYYRVVEGEGISNFGTLVFPVSGTYEVIFRYDLIRTLFWNTVTLTIHAGTEDGTGPAYCGSGSELPVGDTSVQYTSWHMGTGVALSRNFCFRAGRSYTFIISEPVSGQASSPTLDIDSLVAIPINAPSVAVFADSQLVSDYKSCVDVWRRVPTISSAEPVCEEITFTFSTAIYNGAIECDCDPDGSMAETECETFGGQCVCLPGVRGRRCDECTPGTFNFSPTGCNSCLCNPVGSVSDLCQPEQGTCECLPNVAGPDCSSCEPNFWGLTDVVGCIPCSCNEIGSSSLQCDAVSGDCACRSGVTGTQCNTCIEGHYGLSNNGCSPCNCNQAGSLGQNCDALIGQCVCKANTRTRDCSECVSGTFNLQSNNPSGCQPCFCSGLDVTCSAAPGYIAANISTDFSTGIQGWNILSTNFTVHPDPDSVVTTIPFSNGVTILPNSAAFLQAPQQFLGNRLSSYLTFITISLESLGNSIVAEATSQFDVILSGRNLQIGAQFPNLVVTGSEVIQMLLHESFGWYHTATNEAASAEDMQTVLSVLENIFITANFNSSIILNGVQLNTVQEGIDFDVYTGVEQCDCPVGYSGLSCHQCSPGYTRSPTGSCEPCQCNGFSNTCDPDTGACTGCTGSTTGTSCEQCLPGTYGDPSLGISCLPCPCPLTTTPGQFTDECVLQHPNIIICLNCPEGHTGSRCESCSRGYFGDPTGENGPPSGCSDCLCNGNINSSLPNSCNTASGICLQCVNNAAGDMCERCADGYFGDAIIAKNCSACDCNPIGSVDSTCDHLTGQCVCLPNVEGGRCEQCSTGFYGFNSGTGCTLCNCNLEGSMNGQCHPETGQCSCKPGVTGHLCDQCITGFFGFSQDGCQECNCSTTNSILGTCDSSGTCRCQAGSTGTDCNTCIENYFQDSKGCTECPQCYQELEERAMNTSAVLDKSETTLFNLLIETSAYDPRLNDHQSDVNEVETSGEALTQQHDNLQMQVGYLTVVINVTLRREVMQLETSLQVLKTISTPVFIQAQAAEELMNRTIMEFLMAQQEIRLLADFYIPSITPSLSAITNSHTLSTEALESLTSHLIILSSQADHLSDLVSELKSIATVIITEVDNVAIINDNILALTISLQENVTYIRHNVFSLLQQMRYFAIGILQLSVRVNGLTSNLPRIPSIDIFHMLQTNLSTSEYTILQLENQIRAKEANLYYLQDIIEGGRSKVESLSSTLSDFGSRTTIIEDHAQEANGITRATLDDVEQKIFMAENVLTNLQNYSDDTFEVAKRVNEALESVQEITGDANNVVEMTVGIQRNVSGVISVVQDATSNTNNAENVTDAIEEGVSGVDTAPFIASLSSSLNYTESSRQRSLQSQMEANEYQQILAYIEGNTERAEELVRNGSVQVDESEELLSQASSSVRVLERALSSLDNLESSQLQESLHALLSLLYSLESDISSAEIEILYSSLNQSLSEQKAMRQELENSLKETQEEVEQLRHLASLLPANCDSNL